MHKTGKYLVLALGLMVLAPVLVLAWRHFREHKTAFEIQVATNTCACYMDSPPIVVLRIYSKGGLAINSEPVSNGQLVGILRQIYRVRAVRVLYLFPENDTPSQRIAEVIDVVKHLRSEEIKGNPVPKDLRTAPENMNIQMRLVTSGALSAPCPKDCFNWGTQGFPVIPGASTERAGQPIQQ